MAGLHPARLKLIKHQIFREKGQQQIHGKRVRSLVASLVPGPEIDHKTMWCRSGDHSAGNLTLKCREHNQLIAKMELGLARDAYAKVAWQTPDNCRG